MPSTKREVQGPDSLRIATYLKLGDWRSGIRDLGVLTGVGVFLAFLNPFGSVTGHTIVAGVLYWVGLIVYGGIAGSLIARVVRHFLPGLPVWAYAGVLAVLMTIAVLPALNLAQYLMTGRTVPPDRILEFGFYVLLISALVSGVLILGFRAFGSRSSMFDPQPFAAPKSDFPAQVPDAATRFRERLPMRMRQAELFAVQSEDHYLRVHTSAGSELILMRLSDAMRELAEVDGLQTHRSWWVARAGVAEVQKENGKIVLKLKSDVEAPVSRSFAADVRAAGWR